MLLPHLLLKEERERENDGRCRQAKILGLVGLGLRGRLAVVGVQQVRDAAKRGKLKIALVASDASQNSLNKVESLRCAKSDHH